jgi:hypothetical protein
VASVSHLASSVLCGTLEKDCWDTERRAYSSTAVFTLEMDLEIVKARPYIFYCQKRQGEMGSNESLKMHTEAAILFTLAKQPSLKLCLLKGVTQHLIQHIQSIHPLLASTATVKNHHADVLGLRLEARQGWVIIRRT